MRVYREYRNSYPDHIIYYRDGVDDGQLEKIKCEELGGINKACRKIGIEPKICSIIVVKRHHTRFFPKPTQFNNSRKDYNNVEPGTVVDSSIVHPKEVQFFMVSHQSTGTARPTRYTVIENTGKLDINLIQQLTSAICFHAAIARFRIRHRLIWLIMRRNVLVFISPVLPGPKGGV